MVQHGVKSQNLKRQIWLVKRKHVYENVEQSFLPKKTIGDVVTETLIALYQTRFCQLSN